MGQPICLIMTVRHGIEPTPSDTFVSGESWKCPRCGEEFSMSQPTQVDPDRCIFDPTNEGE